MDQKDYKEKVVCKKCGYIVYRDLEKYDIYTDILNKEEKNIYAVFVKKFKCPKCQSTEYNSSITTIDIESVKDIGSEKDIESVKDIKAEIINVNLKPKRTVSKKKVAVV